MKFKQFKTAKGDFLIIEDSVIGDADMIHYSKVSKDMWQLVGKSEQLTEDQAKEVVSSLVKDGNGVKSYVYTLNTLLVSIGVLWENPLGAHPIHPSLTGEGTSILEYEHRVNSWQQADQNVFDKSRTYLFRKV